jgi:hypothetical protein
LALRKAKTIEESTSPVTIGVQRMSMLLFEAVHINREFPSRAGRTRSYDFVFDRCANGQQLKCLTVTDEFTKEGLAIGVDGRLAG